MAFENGAAGLTFYRSSTRTLGHDLPCKVSCSYCRTPILDEGRNMVLLFPTLINFRSAEERSVWKPQYVPTLYPPNRCRNRTQSPVHHSGVAIEKQPKYVTDSRTQQMSHLLLSKSG